MASSSRVPQIIVGNVVPFVIASIFVIARLVSRIGVLRIFLLEDWLLLLSWIAAIVNCGLVVAATRYGSGKHESEVSLAELITFLKLQYADVLLYQFSLTLTKVSLCVMYLRLFGVDKVNRRFLRTVIFVLITTTIALILYNIFQCHPVSGFWNVTEPSTCVSAVPGFWLSFGVSLLADVVILVFSSWQISRLKMSRHDKIATQATLGIGWIAVVSAIVRAIKIDAVIRDHADATYRAYDTSIWGTVEINVALLCTSAIALKPLVRKLFPLFLSTSSGTATAHDRHQWRSLTNAHEGSHSTTIGAERAQGHSLSGGSHIMKDTQLLVISSPV